MAKKSKKTISMPGLGDVETFKTIPEGDYHVRVSDVEQKEGQKGDYLKWELTVVDGPMKDQKLWNNTSFAEKSLWNLKAWLEAMEADIPEEPEDVAINDYVGLELSVSVTHEDYEGKARAKITDFSVLEGDKEEDVDVEEEDDEDGESETYSEEQIRDLDDDELKDLIKKHSLGVKLKEYKTAKKKRSAVISALEEAELMDDE